MYRFVVCLQFFMGVQGSEKIARFSFVTEYYNLQRLVYFPGLGRQIIYKYVRVRGMLITLGDTRYSQKGRRNQHWLIGSHTGTYRVCRQRSLRPQSIFRNFCANIFIDFTDGFTSERCVLQQVDHRAFEARNAFLGTSQKKQDKGTYLATCEVDTQSFQKYY